MKLSQQYSPATDQITLERSARNREEMESTMARRLWNVVRAVLFMLRKGMSKRKLAMDLNLLLHRGKIASKAFSKLMNTHSHHHNKAAAAAGVVPPQQSSFSWRAVDPALAVYDPRGNNREVEFSCSNTPSYYPSFSLIPTGKRRRRSNRRTHRGANGDQPGWYNYDAADIAKVFEILNNSEQLLSDASAGTDQLPSPLALVATPSPALWASFGRTPAHVKQLRVTDSPFPLRDDDTAAGDEQVDVEAEEFIKKFYEQLRKQQSLAGATPDHGYGSSYGGGYARPVTGMA